MSLQGAHKTTEVTTDAVVSAAPALVYGVIVTGAAANATLILYDHASAASGTVIASLNALANSSGVFAPAAPVPTSKGIYADIGGAGAKAYVQWRKT